MQIIIAFATPTTTPNPPSTGTSHATAIDFSGISPRADRDKKTHRYPFPDVRPATAAVGRYQQDVPALGSSRRNATWTVGGGGKKR